EPRVERRREARVRGHVREEEHVPVVGGAELAVQAGTLNDLNAVLEDVVVGRTDDAEIEMAVHTRVVSGCVRRRIVSGLVDDQVRYGARRRIDDGAAGL